MNKHFQYIDRGTRSNAAEKLEAILEGGAAFAGVFGFRRHTESLAKILLMNATNNAVFTMRTVIALNERKCSILHHPRFKWRDIESDGRGKAHREGFVFGCARKARNRRHSRRMNGSARFGNEPDKPFVPPDTKEARRHAFRRSLGSGGGVISNEHPSA